MNTWISKHRSIALLCVLLLSACTEAPGPGFALFAPKSDEKTSGKERADVSLPRADLAGGAVALVPPAGFCVDKRSLKDTFATVARCDALGAKTGAFDASLGLILVSVTPLGGPVNVVQLLPDTFGSDVQVLERFGRDDLALAHLLGGAPGGVDPVYWRGLATINGHLVQLSAYAPKQGSLATAEGGRALTTLVDQTTQASDGLGKTDTVVAQTPRRGGGLRSRISGLFNRKAFVE